MSESQKANWDKIYSGRGTNKGPSKPSEFAKKAAGLFPPNSTILELGCGTRSDSVYFTGLGHLAVATDFLDSVIETNKKSVRIPNLQYKVMDLTQPFPYKDSDFDVVYARLSLHYFDDPTTKQVFGEIRRVLKPGGLLAFMCKSTKDPLYGVGDPFGKDIFVSKGHIRHFFSNEYVLKLLAGKFEVESVDKSGEDFYGHPSSFIEVTARKTG